MLENSIRIQLECKDPPWKVSRRAVSSLIAMILRPQHYLVTRNRMNQMKKVSMRSLSRTQAQAMAP